MPEESHARVSRAEELADLLDSRFTLPGTSWRFGLDPLLGLVPGVGDVVSSGLSLVILFDAKRQGCSRGTLARMALNLTIDAAIGAVPILGDVFDFAYKANKRNLRLMQADLESRRRA